MKRLGCGCAVLFLIAIAFVIGSCAKEYFLFTPSSADLIARVKSADRVEFIKQYGDEKTYLVLRGRPAVADLLEHIKLKKPFLSDRCACLGAIALRFYEGEQPLAEVGFKHGSALDWSGWKYDGLLTSESANYIKDLLKTNGLTEADFQ